MYNVLTQLSFYSLNNILVKLKLKRRRERKPFDCRCIILSRSTRLDLHFRKTNVRARWRREWKGKILLYFPPLVVLSLPMALNNIFMLMTHTFISPAPTSLPSFRLTYPAPQLTSLLKCLTALKLETGTSLVGQCSRLRLPIRGLRIQSLVRELRSKKNQNRKQKQYCNKFNKDFKNGSH